MRTARASTLFQLVLLTLAFALPWMLELWPRPDKAALEPWLPSAVVYRTSAELDRFWCESDFRIVTSPTALALSQALAIFPVGLIEILKYSRRRGGGAGNLVGLPVLLGLAQLFVMCACVRHGATDWWHFFSVRLLARSTATFWERGFAAVLKSSELAFDIAYGTMFLALVVVLSRRIVGDHGTE